MPEFNPFKFFLIADQTPERVYTALSLQYLAYLKQLPQDDDKINGEDGFHQYLTEILGMDKNEADEEVAYFMNAVLDATDQ